MFSWLLLSCPSEATKWMNTNVEATVQKIRRKIFMALAFINMICVSGTGAVVLSKSSDWFSC